MKGRNGVRVVLLAIVLSLVLGVIAWMVMRDREPSNWPVQFRGVIRDVKYGRLIGCTREEIISKYGMPPNTGYFKDWHMVYPIGPERNSYFGIDSDWLVLRVKDDKVIEAKLVTD